MPSEKLFTAVIAYLKIATVFALVMCFVLLFYQSFDPAGGLEMMIVNDLYQTDTLPEIARPMYRFVFLLFDLLSVVALAGQYLVIRYALQKKEKWAYWYMCLIGIAWPFGAAAVALYCKTPAYFVSVGMMTVLFFTPLVILRKYFF